MTLAASAAAARAGNDGSGPMLDTISNGRNGTALKWMPIRPASHSYAVGQTAATEPLTGRQPAAVRALATQPAAAGNAMSDPFGDRMARPMQTSQGVAMQMPPEPPSAIGGPAPAVTAPPSNLKPSPDDKAYSIGPPGRPPTSEAPLEIECPKANDPDFFKSIDKVKTDITVGADTKVPRECELIRPAYEYRHFACTTFMWKASGLCHKPLYWEEMQLERYGHSCGCVLQPVISAAHFFLIFPILPYEMGLEPPNECIYSLGYYRPGSCAPYLLDPIPLSVRAGLFEAGAWVGGAAIIP